MTKPEGWIKLSEEEVRELRSYPAPEGLRREFLHSNREWFVRYTKVDNAESR